MVTGGAATRAGGFAAGALVPLTFETAAGLKLVCRRLVRFAPSSAGRNEFDVDTDVDDETRGLFDVGTELPLAPRDADVSGWLLKSDRACA